MRYVQYHGKKMEQDLETRFEEIFGDFSNSYQEKFHRQKEFLKRNHKQKGKK